MKKFTRILFFVCGTLCVSFAVVGMFVPILPTTPFVLLAAICYARSSERVYHWLLNNRWFGKYIKNYREGRGIPLREKILALIVLWITIGSTLFFVTTRWWVQLILLGIALGVSIHLIRIKTTENDNNAPLVKRAVPPEKLSKNQG